jgi:hypothetical protein
MSRDEIVSVGLVGGFALLVTVHLTLVAGLAARSPRWRAFVALVAAPLAPWWGMRSGMKGRAAAWLISAVAYVVFFWLARR